LRSDLASNEGRLSTETAARGEALADELDAVTGTSLDKGVELDALAKLPKDERKGLIDRAKAGERVSARKEPKTAPQSRCVILALALMIHRTPHCSFVDCVFLPDGSFSLTRCMNTASKVLSMSDNLSVEVSPPA
jgi:hypothetical protein